MANEFSSPDLSNPNSAQGASKKSRKPPKPIRSARMQFEVLEPRTMMAGVADAAPEASSEVLQASLMSAFFEQSSLYSVRMPTSYPTVTWISHLEPKPMEIEQADPLERIERANDLVDQVLREDSHDTGHLTMPPGRGAGASGIRQLIWVELDWPAHVYAPYVDLSESPEFDLVYTAQTEGILYFNLAYMTANDQNRPCWGGDAGRGLGTPFDAALRGQIAKLRSMGGDVAVSFAGPHGKPLAEAITNVGDLQSAYRSVITAYGLQRIDFDLSGPSLDDHAAIERRWQAVGALQRELAEAGTPVDVWVTLPVSRSGLSDAALDVIRSAGEHGVRLDGVNLKPSTTDDPAAARGDASQGRTAVESTFNAYYQLRHVLPPDPVTGTLWTKVGITPVLGRDRSGGATFGPRAAHEVYGFAAQHGVGMLSLWSLNDALPTTDQPADDASAVQRDQGSQLNADRNQDAAAEQGDAAAERDAAEVSNVLRGYTDQLPR